MTEQRTDSMAVATPPSDADGLLTWECVFPRLPCPVQRQLLDRVKEADALTTDDLQQHLVTAFPSRAKSCIDAVLTGQRDCLPNFEVPISYSVDALGGDAIHSPDLALIATHSHANPTPTLVELATGIIDSGRRLLVVTPTITEATAFVDHWTNNSNQAIGLALHPKENSASLSKNSRAYTTTALIERGWTTTRNQMQQRITELQAEQGLLEQARQRLPELHSESQHLTVCQSNCDALDGEVHTLADHPHWLNHPLQSELNSALELHASALEEYQQTELHAHETQQRQASLHAANDGPKSTGLIQKVFGLFRGHSDTESIEQADAEYAATSSKLKQCQCTVTEHETRIDHLKQQIHNEIRQKGLTERQVHEATIAAIHQELRAAGIEARPSRSDDELNAMIDRRSAELAKELPFAERWLAELTEQRSSVDQQALKLIPVIVAPFSALGQDPLTPSRPSQPMHDTALILNAELLGIEEFERIAHYAHSWIMVGQNRDGERSRDRRGIFDRLWQRLDIPLWRREAGQRIARIDGSNRTHSHCEPLADQPDIELRFSKDDDDELTLVEVAFPGDWSLAQGKAFLATELDEVRIETAGPASWTEDDATVQISWPDTTGNEPIRIELGNGITEDIIEIGCRPLTVALQFDRDSWDRVSAQDWIDQHRYCRRTMRLMTDKHEAPARPTPGVRSLAGAVV